MRAERWLDRGLRAVVACAIVAGTLSVWGEASARTGDWVVDLYPASHYPTDEALDANFTKQTGIRIHRIELGDEPLRQRPSSVAANRPAGVVRLVDPTRLWRAQIDGLFQPIQSKVLSERIPAQRCSTDGTWLGFPSRTHALFFDPTQFKAEDIDTYAELADPKSRGKVIGHRRPSVSYFS